jgi:hypothetical protein
VVRQIELIDQRPHPTEVDLAIRGYQSGPDFDNYTHENTPNCHSEPFTVIPSEARNLALPVQGKLREESRSEYFQRSARFLVVPSRSGLLGMTGQTGFSAAC